MHALKPSFPPPQPQRPLRTVPRQKTKVKQRHHRGVLIESTVKLSVNVVLSAVAIGALAQLLPHRSSQAAKLQELQVTVAAPEERVERTQKKFKQYFDPYQTNANMQAQSHRIGTQQRRIVFQRPGRQ